MSSEAGRGIWVRVEVSKPPRARSLMGTIRSIENRTLIVWEPRCVAEAALSYLCMCEVSTRRLLSDPAKSLRFSIIHWQQVARTAKTDTLGTVIKNTAYSAPYAHRRAVELWLYRAVSAFQRHSERAALHSSIPQKINNMKNSSESRRSVHKRQRNNPPRPKTSKNRITGRTSRATGGFFGVKRLRLLRRRWNLFSARSRKVRSDGSLVMVNHNPETPDTQP
jgi:hypothetical protein